MFFFRLHNLQREEANKKKKKIELRQRRGAKVFRRVSRAELSHLTAPSRLFEKTPMNPSDSLDEIALQIPRFDPLLSVVGPRMMSVHKPFIKAPLRLPETDLVQSI